MSYRGISTELLKKKNITYNPSRYCWTIPVYNEYGKSVGNIDHRPEADLKYIVNFKKDNKRPVIYNAEELRSVFYNKEPVFITEGIFDALSVEELGFKAVSTLGAKLNRAQLLILLRYTDKLILFYDSDNPGQMAANRICKKFNADSLLINFKTNLGKDANESLQSNIQSFRQELQQIVKEVMEI